MKSLRGELTDTRNKEKFSLSNSKMVMAIAKSLEVNDQDSIKLINNVITPVLVNSLVSTVSLVVMLPKRLAQLKSARVDGQRARGRLKQGGLLWSYRPSRGCWY